MHWSPAELPHTGPMRWVDRVRLAEDGKESFAEALIAPSHPFILNGKLPRAALIEVMAQGAAAGASLRASRQGKRVTRGLLVALKGLEFLSDVKAGDNVEIRAREEMRLGPLVQGSLEAHVDGRIVARGRMTFHLTFE